MASQPPHAPRSPKAQDEDRKTEPQGPSMQLPLAPAADGARDTRWVPWAALSKAYGHLHLSLMEGRRGRFLTCLDPLYVDLDLPLLHMTEKKLGGNQEPFSKVRTTFKGRGRWLIPYPHVGRAQAGAGTHERPTWLC